MFPFQHVITRLFSKSSRTKVMALLLMPMKRLMQDRDTYAVLGTLKTYDMGYIMGVTDHLKEGELTLTFFYI